MNREDHIQSLLNDPTLKPSTRRVSPRDDATYDTVFSTKDGDALILRVHVPISGNTPRLTSAPKMTLVGFTGRHPWIDSNMKVIGYSPIASSAAFQKSNLSLAQAVNQVVQHMQLNPPSNIIIVDESLRKMNEHVKKISNPNSNGRKSHRQSLSNSNGSSNSNSQSYNTNGHSNGHMASAAPVSAPAPPPPPEYNLPPHFTTFLQMNHQDERKKQSSIDQHTSALKIPPPSVTSFPEIQQMNDRQQINDLLDNMTQPEQMKTISRILSQTPLHIQSQERQQILTESNSKLANQNLQKEEELNVLSASISNLQQTLQEKVELLEELQKKQDELVKPLETKEIMYQLKKAKKVKMEESEDLAYKWLKNDDGIETDDFVEQFLKSRTVHHVRAAKMERIEYSSTKGIFW